MSDATALSRSPGWLLDGFLEHLEWERNLSPAILHTYTPGDPFIHSTEDFLEAYPYLEEEDIRQALTYST